MESQPAAASHRGVEFAHVIDVVAHDVKSGEVALIMLEPRPWDGSELRLFQLQEKINAYLSFALDGEMAAEYPALASLPLRLQLDCAFAPDSMAQHFLGVVRNQIGFQGISLVVRVIGEDPGTQSGAGEA